MQPMIVVSTVGTSVLTHGADKALRDFLTGVANARETDLNPEQRDRIEQRAQDVRAELQGLGPEKVREFSAELNGIVSLRSLQPVHVHYLLHTDTFQGERAAGLVCEWLLEQRCTPVPVKVRNLSTANRESFAAGVDFLLCWCEETLPPLRAGNRKIVFNLVGGFKSLQAYAQTLGMFYADEIVYIFEFIPKGKEPELIRIPRLPLQWDTTRLLRYAGPVARLYHGENVDAGELVDLPEAYIEKVLVGGAEERVLTTWGKMAWLQARESILGQDDLVEQPGIIYEATFKKDLSGVSKVSERAALQDDIARVSVLWRQPPPKGGLTALRADRGLQYDNYARRDDVGHFRVSRGLRVSCKPDGSVLRLRRYGTEPDVNRNP